MAVETTTSGTMTDEKGRSKVSPLDEVKTPEAEEVSPEEEPRIYTQKQMDALLHATKSEYGRKVREIETDRDNLKSQIMTKGNELEDIQAERESLEKQLEDLSSGDPRRFDLIKREKELRVKEREAKEKLLSLDTREREFIKREEKVTAFELGVLIESIAGEYEDADVAKLKTAVGGFEKPTEDKIRAIADIFWEKKAGEAGTKTKIPKVYSGKSEGGRSYYKQSEINALWATEKEEILKAQSEGRIRLDE